MELKVLAPAKINLTLDIIKKRFDGYHDVSMIMQTVSLYDTITLSEAQQQGIHITCNNPDVPCDQRNIVYKCAQRFFEYTNTQPAPINIHIAKTIPAQAGLAGGSTDGAAVIVAMNKMFCTNLKQEQMCEIGAKVGADIPFCIVGGTQHATGTGTTLNKLVAMPKCYIVICKPPVNISTALAYEKADSMPQKGFDYTTEAVKSLYRRDIRMLCSCMYNDFENALEIDEVNYIKKIMYQNKAKGASMSGSGSAVFGVFLSQKHAQNCADILKQEFAETFVCEPINHGCTF